MDILNTITLHSEHLEYINKLQLYSIFIDTTTLKYIIIKQKIPSKCTNLHHIGYDNNNIKVMKNLNEFKFSNNYLNGHIFLKDYPTNKLKQLNAQLDTSGLFIRQWDEESSNDPDNPWNIGVAGYASASLLSRNNSIILNEQKMLPIYSTSIGGYILDSSIVLNCTCPGDCDSDSWSNDPEVNACQESDTKTCQCDPPGCNFADPSSIPHLPHNCKAVTKHTQKPLHFYDSLANMKKFWDPSSIVRSNYAESCAKKPIPDACDCICVGAGTGAQLIDRTYCSYNELVLNFDSYYKYLKKIKGFFYMKDCPYSKKAIQTQIASGYLMRPLDVSNITTSFNRIKKGNALFVAYNCKTMQFEEGIINDPSAVLPSFQGKYTIKDNTNCTEGSGATTSLKQFPGLHTYLTTSGKDLSCGLTNTYGEIVPCRKVSTAKYKKHDSDINVLLPTTISCENICNSISGCKGFTWSPGATEKNNIWNMNTCNFFTTISLELCVTDIGNYYNYGVYYNTPISSASHEGYI